MRLKITLEPYNLPLNLPIHYSHLLQGMIYNQLDDNLSDWLHGEAYRSATRTYKMFTFSRLEGLPFTVKNGQISFEGKVFFKLSSVNGDILSSLAEHLLRERHVRLGSYNCEVKGVEIIPKPRIDVSKPILVRTLSPITTYSTYLDDNEKRKTYYYSPSEVGWSDGLLSNLLRKAEALEWEDNGKELLETGDIQPEVVKERDEKVIMYNKEVNGKVHKTVIKAWMGTYNMSLPEHYFWLAYDVGVGSKNAQGFGMIEAISSQYERRS